MGTFQDTVRRASGLLANLERRAYLRGLLPRSTFRLPDFLCIGAQKAGTTWLWENLRRHPDVYLHDRKELHYWNRRAHRSLRFYSHYFRAAGDRVTGDITPAYSLLPDETVRVIHSLRPDLRILLLLRDPVERAWSHALMELLKVQGRRYEELTAEDFRRHFLSDDCRRRGLYTEILARWEGVLGPERLFTGFYDEIAADGEALMRRICRCLGVQEEVDWSTFPLAETIHGGAGIPLPEEHRAFLEELYETELERLEARFGSPVARWRSARAAVGAGA